MTSGEIDFGDHCESYRGYLTVLAGAHIGSHLRGKLDPADLVQQAMLKACRGRAAFRGEGDAQLRAWLRAILANIVADGLRKFGGPQGRDRSLEVMLDESSRRLECLLKDDGSSPSHKASRQEQILLLTDALTRLPEDQRLAVELRHLHGESLEQIAGRMGRSVASVAGLLRRGIRTLRSELDVLA